MRQSKTNQRTKSLFLAMLLGKLCASLLENLLTGKGVKAKMLGRRVMRAGEGTIRAVEGSIRAGQNF